MTDYVTPTTWEQCARHVEAGGIVEIEDAPGVWINDRAAATIYRGRCGTPDDGWAPRRLVPIESAAPANGVPAVPTGAERYLAERLADPEYRDAYEAAAPVTGDDLPPDGCEAVWLPTDVVDEWVGLPTTDYPPSLAQARATIYACRQAQARRGTPPAPPPAPDDLVSRARRHAETHPESRELIEELLEVVVTEDDLRRIVERSARLGDWDEWTKTALGGYNALTVTARAVLGHLHGQHDDSALPYSHCLLCELFRDARRGSTPTPSPVPPWPDGVLRDAANRLRWIANSGYIEGPGIKRIIRSWADELDATLVPPWPGAVLSGLCDEDGVPTWLAQAGQVRGERVRCSRNLSWVPNHGGYGPTVWVEVRAPRAVPVPETERVPWWEAVGREVTDQDGERVTIEHVQCGDGAGPSVAAYNAAERRDTSLLRVPMPVRGDGTVEVLKDGDQ